LKEIFFFINEFSKIVLFFNQTFNLDSAPSRGGQETLMHTSLGPRLRQNHRFQSLVSYLHVLGSWCFLFTRWLWSVYTWYLLMTTINH